MNEFVDGMPDRFGGFDSSGLGGYEDWSFRNALLRCELFEA
jgi:hypothetical protein